MADVFGVVAGATQLAATCLTLVELARKIKGGCSSLQNYQMQLQETRRLSQAISQNPLLQTPEVEICVYSLLDLINQYDLKPLIERSRFSRYWAVISKDRELSEVFTSLERYKTNLSLIIHNLQAQAIHHMQADIQAMADSQSSDAPTYGEPIQSSPIHNIQEMPSKDLVVTRSSTADTEEETPPQQPSNLGSPPMSNPFGAFNMGREEFEEACKMRKLDHENNPNSNFYYNNHAHDAHMHNGTLYSCIDRAGGMGAPNINLHPNTFLNNFSIGNSDMHNGNCYDIRGDTQTNMPQLSANFYVNNRSFSRTTTDHSVVRGKLHNGDRLFVNGKRDETMERED